MYRTEYVLSMKSRKNFLIKLLLIKFLFIYLNIHASATGLYTNPEVIYPQGHRPAQDEYSSLRSEDAASVDRLDKIRRRKAQLQNKLVKRLNLQWLVLHSNRELSDIQRILQQGEIIESVENLLLKHYKNKLKLSLKNREIILDLLVKIMNSSQEKNLEDKQIILEEDKKEVIELFLIREILLEKISSLYQQGDVSNEN